MKKIVLIFGLIFTLLFITASACAITWHSMNQATMCWTPPTTYSDGSTIPADALIEHEVFITQNADKSNPTSLGRTSDNCKLITLTDEGKFYAGVKAVRIVDGAVVSESPISWGDDPAAAKDGNTFGLQHYLIPDLPIELYKQ